MRTRRGGHTGFSRVLSGAHVAPHISPFTALLEAVRADSMIGSLEILETETHGTG